MSGGGEPPDDDDDPDGGRRELVQRQWERDLWDPNLPRDEWYRRWFDPPSDQPPPSDQAAGQTVRAGEPKRRALPRPHLARPAPAIEETYHGTRDGVFGPRNVLVEGPDGQELRPLRYWKHDISEFNWGYLGSSAIDLARCLLIDLLDTEAMCPDCGGEARLRFVDGQPQRLDSTPNTLRLTLVGGPPRRPDPAEPGRTCPFCREGVRLDLPHLALAEQVIAGLPPEWRLASTKLRRWYDDYRRVHG